MKANNGTGNNIERDEWETPKWLFNKLHKQFNFKYDCCASKENTKTKDYSEIDFQDIGLVRSTAWMNPPFSKALEMFRHFFKVIKKGVAIYRCDNMETKVWQQIILPNASWVFIPNKRIAYEGMEGSGSRFPSALIGFNVPLIESLVGITLKPFGSFNMGLKASAQEPTPKLSPTEITSPNPNIMPNLWGELQALSNLPEVRK